MYAETRSDPLHRDRSSTSCVLLYTCPLRCLVRALLGLSTVVVGAFSNSCRRRLSSPTSRSCRVRSRGLRGRPATGYRGLRGAPTMGHFTAGAAASGPAPPGPLVEGGGRDLWARK